MEYVELRNIKDLTVDNAKILLDSGRLQNKKVILFGINKPLVHASHYLMTRGVKIAYAVDNGISLANAQHYEGEFHIQSPEILREVSNKESYHILIASKHYTEMCKQLDGLGFDTSVQATQLYQYETCLANDIPAEKRIDDKKLREIQLDILDFFAETCRRKGLRFYLCGGTLLGAVRHKGYIPWDDDIDVYMPMPDYLEFLNSFEENDTYCLQNSDTSITPYMFTKLANKKTTLQEFTYPFLGKFGVNIDIFPSSGLPDDPEIRQRFEQECFEIRQQWKDYLFEQNLEDADAEEYQNLKKRYMELITRYPFDEAKMVAYVITANFEREMNTRTGFESTVEVEFEGKKYPAMVGYDEYMTHLYGSYMELPPEKDRVSKHVYRAWFD